MDADINKNDNLLTQIKLLLQFLDHALELGIPLSSVIFTLRSLKPGIKRFIDGRLD
jgi:hypothetical protein